MRNFEVYLNFNGTCRQAMEFYARCLDAELELQTFADAHMKEGNPDGILHARLKKGSALIMASDAPPSTPIVPGNNLHVSVDCETVEETDRFYRGLAEGGKETMPLSKTFWGAYFGMLTDKFGVNWMFNCDLPKE